MKKRINGATFAVLAAMCLVLLSACGAGSVAPPAAPTAIAATGAPAGATKAPATGATAVPVGKGNSKLNCQALANAFLDVEGTQPFLMTLVGGGGSLANRPDSAFYVDTARLRTNLDILATLPDSGD